jgi:hypothetical protein
MKEFFNEYGGIISLIALILTIPLAIVANLWTPKARDWLAGTSLRRRDARIARLRRELEQATEWLTSPSLLIVYGIERFCFLLLQAIVTIVVFVHSTRLGLSIFLLEEIVPLLVGRQNINYEVWGRPSEGLAHLIYLGFLFWLAYEAMKTAFVVGRVRDYKEYKADIEERIRKLEGTVPT